RRRKYRPPALEPEELTPFLEGVKLNPWWGPVGERLEELVERSASRSTEGSEERARESVEVTERSRRIAELRAEIRSRRAERSVAGRRPSIVEQIRDLEIEEQLQELREEELREEELQPRQ